MVVVASAVVLAFGSAVTGVSAPDEAAVVVELLPLSTPATVRVQPDIAAVPRAKSETTRRVCDRGFEFSMFINSCGIIRPYSPKYSLNNATVLRSEQIINMAKSITFYGRA